MGKFNLVDLPNGSPDSWEGHVLVLEKSGPRSIPDALTGPGSAKVTRRGIPQIEKDDELWICTDKFGPGICAVAQVRDAVVSSGNIEIRLDRTISIENPIKLSDFERLQSGSKVFGQLQRSRGPDLYFITDRDFEEFEEVILARKGSKSLPELLDRGESIEPNGETPNTEFAGGDATEFRPSVQQEAYRMAMLIFERVKRGGESGLKVNPLRSAPNLSDLNALLIQKWGEQAGRCALCGGALVAAGGNKMLQPSADRTDSSNGAYDDGNVAITHLACNLAKNKYGLDEFEDWLSILRGVDL